MTGSEVDRDYVTSHPGVYFFLYSVPQVLAVNLRLPTQLGFGAEIYHSSIIYSDGSGAVETITAGPEAPGAWYRQFGFAQIAAQIAFLAHPDPKRIVANFDTVAWTRQEVRKLFISTDFTAGDFEAAKMHVKNMQSNGLFPKYHLGGHNSNTVFNLVCLHLTRSHGFDASANPAREVLRIPGVFRPGSSHLSFKRGLPYYRTMAIDGLRIARRVVAAATHLGTHAWRRLLLRRTKSDNE